MSGVVGWEQFASDLAAVHGEGFVRDFCKTIVDERRAEEELAFERQRRIAAATQSIDNHFVDGLGECTMRIDLTAWWYWTHRYGRGIWSDPDFVKAYKRDNPDVRVKSKSRKIQVGYR
jgi:hypothetical protein